MNVAVRPGLADRLALRPLSVVAEGDEFVVGDPDRNVYVLLPAVGVQAIELLRTGSTLDDTRTALADAGAPDVEIVDFAAALCDLGFAAIADAGQDDDVPDHAVRRPTFWESAFRPERVRFLFSRRAWITYALCAAGSVALLIGRPGLFPATDDLFLLGTPARSIAALTLIMVAVAGVHEAGHYLAARAEGVTARFAVSRRLYLMTLETDLSQLWALPRRRRYGPLLAGMATNAVGLFVLLVLRAAGDVGWWSPPSGVAKFLAALTFVEVMMIVSQLWIFMRTDVYALLVTATGCVNLWRVNQLLVRRTLKRGLSAAEADELRHAHARDVVVARWYVWVYVAGIALAAWFFVAFFAPATVRVIVWMGTTVADAGVDTVAFWEALVFGTIILLPKAATAYVAVGDLRRQRSRALAPR